MSNYRRRRVPGGSYFFTAVTEARQPLFSDANARRLLGDAFRSCQTDRPFESIAIVLLPDHLHAIWRLPQGDSDYSTRWSFIKSAFTRSWLAAGGSERAISASRKSHRKRGVWQRRFWEHHIADEDDLRRHLDYIHYNPVKHNHAACPHAWEWSSFHRWVAQSGYERDWQCQCDGRSVIAPNFSGMEELELE